MKFENIIQRTRQPRPYDFRNFHPSAPTRIEKMGLWVICNGGSS